MRAQEIATDQRIDPEQLCRICAQRPKREGAELCSECLGLKAGDDEILSQPSKLPYKHPIIGVGPAGQAHLKRQQKPPTKAEPRPSRSKAKSRPARPERAVVYNCKCGETSPEKFYPYMKSKCKACHYDQQKRRILDARQSTQERLQAAGIEPVPAANEQAPPKPEKASPEVGQVTGPAQRPLKTCRSCQDEFEPYAYGVCKPNICPACLAESNRLNRLRISRKRLERAGYLVVDTCGQSGLLDALHGMAKKEFRTMEQQVLYMLATLAG